MKDLVSALGLQGAPAAHHGNARPGDGYKLELQRGESSGVVPTGAAVAARRLTAGGCCGSSHSLR